MKKHTIKVIAICLMIDVCLVGLMSCNTKTKNIVPTKKATVVTIHSDKDIIIEVLHEGTLDDGVYKFKIDSNEYIVYQAHYNACAITKHN